MFAIYSQDEYGNEKTYTHQFSMDGTRPNFRIGARFALMGHISVVCNYMFCIVVSNAYRI